MESQLAIDFPGSRDGYHLLCWSRRLVWGLSYIVSSLGVAIVMLTSQVLDLASNGVEQG